MADMMIDLGAEMEPYQSQDSSDFDDDEDDDPEMTTGAQGEADWITTPIEVDKRQEEILDELRVEALHLGTAQPRSRRQLHIFVRHFAATSAAADEELDRDFEPAPATPEEEAALVGLCRRLGPGDDHLATYRAMRRLDEGVRQTRSPWPVAAAMLAQLLDVDQVLDALAMRRAALRPRYGPTLVHRGTSPVRFLPSTPKDRLMARKGQRAHNSDVEEPREREVIASPKRHVYTAAEDRAIIKYVATELERGEDSYSELFRSAILSGRFPGLSALSISARFRKILRPMILDGTIDEAVCPEERLKALQMELEFLSRHTNRAGRRRLSVTPPKSSARKEREAGPAEETDDDSESDRRTRSIKKGRGRPKA